MHEVLPGVWHWTAEHPRIHVDVSSYYLETGRAVLDPLLSGDGLDRPIDAVILTNRLHGRDTEQIVNDHGARVRSPRPGLQQFEGRPYTVEGYDWGDEILPGVHAHELGAICPDDGVLHIAAGAGALHFADGLLLVDGELQLMPEQLMDDPETVTRISHERLRPLLDLDFDALLFAHSDPVLSGGRDRLAAFLGAR